MGGDFSRFDDNDWEKANGRLPPNDPSATVDGSPPTSKYEVYELVKRGVNQREYDIVDSQRNLLYTTRAVPGTIAWFDVLGPSSTDADPQWLLRVQVDLSRRTWIVYRYGVPVFAGQKPAMQVTKVAQPCYYSSSSTTTTNNNNKEHVPIDPLPLPKCMDLYKTACITVSWSRYMAVVARFGPPPLDYFQKRTNLRTRSWSLDDTNNDSDPDYFNRDLDEEEEEDLDLQLRQQQQQTADTVSQDGQDEQKHDEEEEEAAEEDCLISEASKIAARRRENTQVPEEQNKVLEVPEEQNKVLEKEQDMKVGVTSGVTATAASLLANAASSLSSCGSTCASSKTTLTQQEEGEAAPKNRIHPQQLSVEDKPEHATATAITSGIVTNNSSTALVQGDVAATTTSSKMDTVSSPSTGTKEKPNKKFTWVESNSSGTVRSYLKSKSQSFSQLFSLGGDVTSSNALYGGDGGSNGVDSKSPNSSPSTLKKSSSGNMMPRRKKSSGKQQQEMEHYEMALEGVIQLDVQQKNNDDFAMTSSSTCARGHLFLCQEIFTKIIGNHQTSLVTKDKVVELLRLDHELEENEITTGTSQQRESNPAAAATKEAVAATTAATNAVATKAAAAWKSFTSFRGFGSTISRSSNTTTTEDPTDVTSTSNENELGVTPGADATTSSSSTATPPGPVSSSTGTNMEQTSPPTIDSTNNSDSNMVKEVDMNGALLSHQRSLLDMDEDSDLVEDHSTLGEDGNRSEKNDGSPTTNENPDSCQENRASQNEQQTSPNDSNSCNHDKDSTDFVKVSNESVEENGMSQQENVQSSSTISSDTQEKANAPGTDMVTNEPAADAHDKSNPEGNEADEDGDEQPLVGYWIWKNSILVHKMHLHLSKNSDLALYVCLAILVNQVRYERNAIAMTV